MVDNQGSVVPPLAHVQVGVTWRKKTIMDEKKKSSWRSNNAAIGWRGGLSFGATKCSA